MRQRIHIPKYDWIVDIMYDVRPRDAKEAAMRLADMGCPMRHICRAEDLILSGVPNQGFTYTDRDDRHTLVVIGHASSIGEFFNSFSHECNHTVDHISQYYGIPLDSEENAYLTGDMAALIWEDAVRCAIKIWKRLK